MSAINEDLLPVVNKKYKVFYKNEYDQVDTLEGQLVHTDTNGFIVLYVDNRRILIPKDRICIMRELGVE